MLHAMLHAMLRAMLRAIVRAMVSGAAWHTTTMHNGGARMPCTWLVVQVGSHLLYAFEREAGMEYYKLPLGMGKVIKKLPTGKDGGEPQWQVRNWQHDDSATFDGGWFLPRAATVDTVKLSAVAVTTLQFKQGKGHTKHLTQETLKRVAANENVQFDLQQGLKPNHPPPKRKSMPPPKARPPPMATKKQMVIEREAELLTPDELTSRKQEVTAFVKVELLAGQNCKFFSPQQHS